MSPNYKRRAAEPRVEYFDTVNGAAKPGLTSGGEAG